MKKYHLLGIVWVTLVSLTVTTLFAQTTTGTALIDKMKAAAHTFTLAGDLNPGQTGLTSDPVKGKKTGDILTAGEWNRMLELVGEGGGGGSGWVNVPLTDTADFDKSCLYRFQTWNNGHPTFLWNSPFYIANAVSSTQLTWWLDMVGSDIRHISSSSKTKYRINGVEYTGAGGITKIEKLCGGGGDTSWGTGELVMSEMSPTTYSQLIDAVNYCRNLTENGITNWKLPSYGDLVNFIDPKYSQDMLWVADFDGTQTASHIINKDYFGSIRMSDGYWSVSGGGDGSNKVRCVAQMGGGSAWGATGDTFVFLDAPVTLVNSWQTKTDKWPRAKAIQIYTHCANYTSQNQWTNLKFGQSSASLDGACSVNSFWSTNDVDNNTIIIPLAPDGKTISYSYDVPTTENGWQVTAKIQSFIVAGGWGGGASTCRMDTYTNLVQSTANTSYSKGYSCRTGEYVASVACSSTAGLHENQGGVTGAQCYTANGQPMSTQTNTKLDMVCCSLN
jgi:hypothetical protein